MAKMRRKETFVRWDAVDHLKSEADIARYFDAALAEGGDDPALLTAVLGDIAKARGILNIAEETGMTRQGLYKALAADGNPSFATVYKVSRALGLNIRFSPQRTRNERRAARSASRRPTTRSTARPAQLR